MAEEKETKAEAEARKKAEAEKAEAEAKAKADADAKAKVKKVRVICEGTLGPKLLKKGDVTDDAEYIALLGTKRGKTLVEEAK